MNRHRLVAALAVLSAFLLLAACGDDSKVGSDKLKDFESKGGSGALGGTTSTVKPTGTTVAAPQATAPPTTPKPAAVTTTTARAVATTTAPTPTTAAAGIVVKIQGDNQGNAFEPSNTRAYQNTTIRFQNVDSAPHQVKARKGEFESPSIPPGGTWDFRLTLPPGTYEYTDAARPYAVGYLEVLAR